MRRSCLVSLLLLLSVPGFAQSHNRLGMFFGEPFTSANTNFENNFAPFQAYVVLLTPTVHSVAGYEVGIGLSESVYVLSVTGTNGWTNFGTDRNYLAGY